MLGDVGSGYYLGVEALAAVMRSHDGSTGPTLLTKSVLQKTNCNVPSDLISWTYQNPSHWERFAAISPAVEECAQAGDEAALLIMENAVKGILNSVQTVQKKVGFGDKDCWKLVLAGGVLVRSENQAESPYSKMLKVLFVVYYRPLFIYYYFYFLGKDFKRNMGKKRSSFVS